MLSLRFFEIVVFFYEMTLRGLFHDGAVLRSSDTYFPWLRMTVQLGQQSWLTRHRLGKRPTPTACNPLWSLRVNPLHLICKNRHRWQEG